VAAGKSKKNEGGNARPSRPYEKNEERLRFFEMKSKEDDGRNALGARTAYLKHVPSARGKGRGKTGLFDTTAKRQGRRQRAGKGKCSEV